MSKDSHNPLVQRLPIVVTIPLTGLGYDEGSEARAIVNPTRNWRRAWDEPYVPRPAEKDADGKIIKPAETVREYNDRVNDALFPIIPHLIKSVTLKVGDATETFVLHTAEDVHALYDLDPAISALVIDEALRRGDERVVSASRDFRSGDKERAASPGGIRDTGGGVVADPDPATEPNV